MGGNSFPCLESSPGHSDAHSRLRTTAQVFCTPWGIPGTQHRDKDKGLANKSKDAGGFPDLQNGE